MNIKLKRAYEKPAAADGYRVLVDRLWPRGVKKQAARLDVWARDLAPSDALRKWSHHDSAKWVEFKRRYHAELRSQRAALKDLFKQAGRRPLTLVYAARDERRNNAVALREYLLRIGVRTRA